MAGRNRFIRYLAFQWDRDAARRLQDEAKSALEKTGSESAKEFEKAMQTGGQKGARALTTSLQREYRLRMARLQQQLADGAIDERQFRREGEKAAREFNRGLSDGIKKLQGSTGGLSDAQFAGLGSRFKTTGAGGGMFALGARSLLAPLAGLFTAREALSQARSAIEAADELDNSIRKLGGTARLTGIDLQFLESTAAQARESFKLSVPIANDLTTEVARLTAKAGDIDRTSDALESFLDIGAARGLSAEQTLQAVGQAILGIDEGTDKLFGKNPSAIYDEWARAIGRTGTSLSDQEKALALVDAAIAGGATVRGEYLTWLGGTQGQAAQATMQIRELQAEIGRAIQPTRLFALELKTGLYEALVLVAKGLSIAAEGWQRYLRGLPRGAPLTAAEASPLAGGTWEGPERPAGFGRSTVLNRREEMLAAMNQPAIARPEAPLFGGSTDPTSREKAAAEARVTALWKHLDDWMLSQGHRDMMSRLLYGPDGGGGMNLGMQAEGETAFQQYADLMLRIDSISTDVANSVAGAWQDTFALMIDEGATVGNFFEGLGRGIAGALGGALAQFAAGEAKKHFASALGAAAYALNFTAIGNFASASAAWASAAQHTAAGVAFSAIAGAGGAVQGAVRTRGAGSTFDAGLSTGRDGAISRERLGPEIHIYVDGMDPQNPEHQRLTYQTLSDARERFGEDAKVTYHPRNAT